MAEALVARASARRGEEEQPLLLTIDTSTRYAGVGLARGETLLAEYTWQAGINHTVQLLPVVKAVLQENGARLAGVGVIAIASGPGSFNGLRVGMATAKAFCRTLGVPLIAVGTLEVEAYPHAAFPGHVCAVHDAGRGDLAWATFTGVAEPSPDREGGYHATSAQPTGRWRRVTTEQISNPDVLAAALKHSPTLICGEPPAWALPGLMEHGGPNLVHARPAASLRRPASLAELAWLRHLAGDHADVETLQPLYLRRPPGGG